LWRHVSHDKETGGGRRLAARVALVVDRWMSGGFMIQWPGLAWVGKRTRRAWCTLQVAGPSLYPIVVSPPALQSQRLPQAVWASFKGRDDVQVIREAFEGL